MRKWSTKVLAAALGLSLLAGCGGGSGNGNGTGSSNGKGDDAAASQGTAPTASAANGGKKTELTFYYPIAVGGPLTNTIEAMTADFEKEHPDIDVTPVYTGSYADTAVKTQAGVQAKQPPDVAVLQSTELFSLLDMNAIVPLDDFIAKEGNDYLADFYPAFMANSQTDGHTYSLPFQRSTIVLYYNKEMFKEAGLDPEKGPANWEEMQDYAIKLKKDGRHGLEIPVTGFAYWMMQTFALQNGENLMTQDGKKVMFDTPENVEGLQYWVDLAAKHKAMPEGVTDWSTVPSDFLEGKTAMMYHTTGNLTNVKKNATFDFGVSFLPAKKQYGSPTGGGNFYIFKDISPEKQQAAWEFVKFMTEPERAAQWSIDTGYVAVRKSAYETERMKKYAGEFPAALVARDQLEYAAAELSTHNNGKVMKILNDNVQAALTGTLSPAEALKKAQTEADQALASFNK